MAAKHSFKIAVFAALIASTAAVAQSGGSGGSAASGTSAGSGASGATSGTAVSGNVTGGASGTGLSTKSNSGDRSIDAQDRAVDTKIKSICKGC